VNEATLKLVFAELQFVLVGRGLGKIFQLGKYSLAFDFRPHFGSYLFLSVEPTAPRIYLIERRLRELEKQSEMPSNFLLFVRKRLSNSLLVNLTKIPDDRILRFEFFVENETVEKYSLILQLTGRAANLFLLDGNGLILDSLRESVSQKTGDCYQVPVRESSFQNPVEEPFPHGQFPSLSAALDAHFQQLEAEQQFQKIATQAETKIKQEISRREKLLAKLRHDLEAHGNAEQHKKIGDLILANIGTAKRLGNKVELIDYFDENLGKIEIETNENQSLTEAAESYFKRYTKARNAKQSISHRLEDLEKEIAVWKLKKTEIEGAIANRDEAFLAEFVGRKPENKKQTAKKSEPEKISGTRQYISSDGYEILVGRGSKDNDYLTLRVAKSLDWWFHAADYAGSHVVVRNKTKGDLPPKTLIEAAQLAAKFSKAGQDSKVAVHYTQRKFVSKPKNAAPGLVRLSSFKTILVEPGERVERVKG
jgi:predicted ribosome quality control (RQC) complex YloA/Tae2 family protein